MRPEHLYLTDIVEASDAIARFCAGVGYDEFMADELRQSAVLQKLTIIGEAAARLPKEFRERHSEIEWAEIIGFRNIAVHQYFVVKWDIAWVTATEDVPGLRSQVAKFLADEYASE